jgi:hypothetical protein
MGFAESIIEKEGESFFGVGPTKISSKKRKKRELVGPPSVVFYQVEL